MRKPSNTLALMLASLALLAATVWVGIASAEAPAPSLRQIATQANTLEAKRAYWKISAPLSLLTSNGPHALTVGEIITQTRTLATPSGAYAYAVSFDGAHYGLVSIESLTRAGIVATSNAAAGNIFLDALARLSPGEALRSGKSAYAQNSGLTRLPMAARGSIALTLDFCPTSRRMEESFLKELVKLGKQRGKPIALTAFMSGRWLTSASARRKRELETLRAWAESGALDVTFANHSDSHPYHGGTLSASQDFLLHRSVDFRREVLGTELALMRSGLMPAPFFRFPGLISSSALQRELRETYSLIDTGAGSWPGLAQKVATGDVVLLHGNGGEPEGIRRFRQWLGRNRSRIVSGEIDVVPPSVLLRP